MRLGLGNLFFFATEVIHLHSITALAQIVRTEQWAGSVLQHILERMSRKKEHQPQFFLVTSRFPPLSVITSATGEESPVGSSPHSRAASAAQRQQARSYLYHGLHRSNGNAPWTTAYGTTRSLARHRLICAPHCAACCRKQKEPRRKDRSGSFPGRSGTIDRCRI